LLVDGAVEAESVKFRPFIAPAMVPVSSKEEELEVTDGASAANMVLIT
jgi:hypothetical protein